MFMTLGLIINEEKLHKLTSTNSTKKFSPNATLGDAEEATQIRYSNHRKKRVSQSEVYLQKLGANNFKLSACGA
jgi:hypothetical protein